MKVMYIHPKSSDGSLASLSIVSFLEEHFKGCEIVDLSEVRPTYVFKLTCQKCMEEHLKGNLFKIIEDCEAIAVWSITDTCETRCLINEAWRQGKTLYFIEINKYEEVDIDITTLKEFHMMGAIYASS